MTRASRSSGARLPAALTVAACVALTISACATGDQPTAASTSTAGPTPTDSVDQVVTARIGERVQVGELYVTPLDIISDSRCPRPDVPLASYGYESDAATALLDWCTHPGWITLLIRVEDKSTSDDISMRNGWPHDVPSGTLGVSIANRDGTLFTIDYSPDG